MKVLCILIFLLAGPFSAFGNGTEQATPLYRPLLERLTQDGFDPKFLNKIWTDERTTLIPSLMTISLGLGETSDLYAQFLELEQILLSKKFLRQNLKILREMEKKYHVDKEVVVAILLVESRFGENIGRHRVIPSLTSIALIDSEDNLRENYLTLRGLDPDLTYEWMEGRAKRKAAWAYHELKCFLKIIRHEKMDPLEIKGSSAGALGMAQFIPSSYLNYAVSKKGLTPWLLDKKEAIFSIGNYLRSHGWKKNLTDEKKRKVLWSYNRSEPYITTILQVARKIKY